MPVIGVLPGSALAPVPGAVRPTAGLWPTVAQVSALLPRRGSNGTFLDPTTTDRGTTPTATQVANLISLQAGDIDAELLEAPLTPAVRALVTLLIAVSTAATVELSFFPDSPQGGISGMLWARYQESLTRLRMLLTDLGRGLTQDMTTTVPIRRGWRYLPIDVARPVGGFSGYDGW